MMWPTVLKCNQLIEYDFRGSFKKNTKSTGSTVMQIDLSHASLTKCPSIISAFD